ncbi:MAG: translocase [Planctomycetota bacterium]
MRSPHKHNPDRRVSSILPPGWHRWRWEAVARRVWDESQKLMTTSAVDLQQRARLCRGQVKLATVDEPVIVEVFALVREISGRVHGIRHHPVQILGALAMSHGWIAEMRTGEGKTLTSLMTVTLLALRNRGCHVLTANDYLAARDCEFAKPVLDWFGLTATVLHAELPAQERAACYRADVTYGSEKEFGFDFLRDRLSSIAAPGDEGRSANRDTNSKIQDGHVCALIDEADSILIDQASTPMIISCPQPPSADDLELLHWCEHFSGTLTAATDFALDPRLQAARLTHRGCRKLRLTVKPTPVGRLPVESVFTQVERALAARHFFRENREYLVIEERLEIIDQGTGRVLPGRKWRDGLQQAIELRAGLPPSDACGSAARVTLQSYLRNYRFLCGMTGTAAEARSELRNTYGLRVMSIATHQPCRLLQLPTRIYASSQQKWSVLIAELERIALSGRAVLVGTTSIVASEQCAAELRQRGLDVQVLHAKHHREESEIVRLAGQPGRITVATNMAGRGTDIQLHPDVRAAGGLHVMLSEMNRSARIDRQLAGRAARQGDPGSYQIFVSLEDELLTILGAKRVSQWKNLARRSRAEELPRNWISHFARAQRLFERRSEQERNQLLVREQKQWETMLPLGLDPYIELPTDV